MKILITCPHCSEALEVDANTAPPGSKAECPYCERSLEIPEHEVGSGTVIGGFRLRTELGRGAMGTVYHARHESAGTEYAVKVMPPGFALRKDEVDRFIKEVEFASKLDHPHLVRTFQSGRDSGIYFLVMEYVEGETLADRLDRGPLPAREALLIVRKVATALAHAWNELQLLHRDIKPDNIMLGAAGEPQLMDLGLSHSLAGDGGPAGQKMLLGTPNYMAPEQARGEHQVDVRADMYGLGTTLHHMLTGELPFNEEKITEVLRRQIEEPLPDPREHGVELGEETVKFLERLLAKERVYRPLNWEAFLRELDETLSRL